MLESKNGKRRGGVGKCWGEVWESCVGMWERCGEVLGQVCLGEGEVREEVGKCVGVWGK